MQVLPKLRKLVKKINTPFPWKQYYIFSLLLAVLVADLLCRDYSIKKIHAGLGATFTLVNLAKKPSIPYLS